ncbi:MAG: chorismate mutase [Syntrophothermus sp.]
MELLNKRPLIIAGPCGAESEEQVISTALQLKETGKVDVFRAGIWKPRTRPGTFEGVGIKGLPWLQKVKELTGFPITTEVSTAKQVEDALYYNIDILWIGARTAGNPASVQEISNALRGTNVPILIKNPMIPDIDLWMGAYERILKAGINNIGFIHRGFSTFGNTEFRNAPMWHLAIEMKRHFPDIMMICDPSHICGRRDTLHSVSQKAIDLDYDGLMIESHINPDSALSDAKQQLTPDAFNELLNSIVWRKKGTNETSFNVALDKLREQIDHLDNELLHILSQRMKISEKIGKYKKDNNIKILQAQRWNDVIDKAFKVGEAKGLSREFITKYFEAIHMESISHQNKIMNNE